MKKKYVEKNSLPEDLKPIFEAYNVAFGRDLFGSLTVFVENFEYFQLFK